MKKASVAYVLRISLTLLLITGVVAALLAGVNMITAPIIAAANEAKTQEAVNAILPGGGTPVTFGQIDMMVGIGKDGNILGISIISHTETAGLGAVAAAENAKGEAFRDQFIGMSGSVSVTKDGGEVDAVTGATVTSRAICDGVNAALACVANLG